MRIKNKKLKKDDELIGRNRFGSINPSAFGNNFNLEELLNNHSLGRSNAFNNYSDLNGTVNKASLDFSKIFNNNDF